MIRIVKMTFKTEMIDQFIEVFEGAKPKIEALPGCSKVDLIQEINDPRIIKTQSIWESPEALEEYRHSELFKSTWAKTKILFDDKPQAWSLEKIR